MSELTVDPYSFMRPFYDHWSKHMTEDVPFYVRHALSSGGPVVELGAGNGRVTIPIAQAGVRVIAVDVSDAMLTESERRAAIAGVRENVTYVRGDMRSFVAPEPVPLVVIPFRSFMHNLTTSDQLATLSSVRSSLTDEGLFILNLFTVDPEKVVAFEGRARLQVEYADEYGRHCEVWATNFYEPGTQILRIAAELRVFEDDRIVATSDAVLTLRTIYRYEFEHLLARAELEPVALYGGFDEKPYGPGPDEMVWIVRKR